ncbi:dUTP diphosphatase [Candidatus Wolfebacteria bacterium]|nr:MAG: dUTP diphosphatase [Candidatus Wolfebacteria bacterium]
MEVKIKRIHKDARLPEYAHKGDAGMDLFCCDRYIIQPGERILVSTGLSIELPEGYVSLIWDKSGIAIKKGITTLGGVIEHTYRGEYGVILFNTSKEVYELNKGDKIAQLLIQPIVTAQIEEVDELSDSVRDEGGFGSTGI